MCEVSVIIPNYNHAPFLNARIDSVLKQTYQDFEVIILDDNSPDNSQQVINTYKDHPKVKHIVFNTVNGKSTFKQWEKGIELASGKYIWIAESDDKAEPNFLSSLVKGFEDKNVGIAFCESFWINSNDEEVRFIDTDSKESYHLGGTDFIKKYMLTGNRIYNASMAIFKKELFLEAVTPEYKQFAYAGDYMMWVQIAMKCNVFYLNEKLNYYRRHVSTVSYQSERKGLPFTEGMRIQFFIKKNIDLSQKELSATAKYLSNKLAYHYIVLTGINTKNLLKVYQTIFQYYSTAFWAFPVYFIKNSLLYPYYKFVKKRKII
jgi:glycosyltransferase involved in cell wall biosynthesis